IVSVSPGRGYSSPSPRLTGGEARCALRSHRPDHRKYHPAGWPWFAMLNGLHLFETIMRIAGTPPPPSRASIRHEDGGAGGHVGRPPAILVSAKATVCLRLILPGSTYSGEAHGARPCGRAVLGGIRSRPGRSRRRPGHRAGTAPCRPARSALVGQTAVGRSG